MNMFLSWLVLLLFLATLGAAAYLTVALLRLPVLRHRGGLRAPVRPPVTLLVPLAGLETELEENLRTLCRQDYPHFQVVFGVAEETDPALSVIRRVLAGVPEANRSLVVGGPLIGPNPRTSTLANMLPAARHDLLVVVDGTLRVDGNFLAAVAAPFADPQMGAVVTPASGTARGGLAALLVALGITDWGLPATLVASRLQTPEGFGAALAVRRQALEATGGFLSLAGFLADDFQLIRRLRQAGWQVRLSSYVVERVSAEPDLASLFAREVRQARTLRACRPGGYPFGFLAAGGLCLATLLLLVSGFSPVGWLIFCTMTGLRLLLHYRLRSLLRVAPPATPWLLPLRDLFSLGVWAAGLVGWRVLWRHHRFRLGRGGRIEEVAPEPRHLVVTADAFGLSLPVNQAVEQAHRQGLVTAAGLMVGAEAAADAIARAAALPSLRVGLQLVLTGGWPLLPPSEIPTLVAVDGRFPDRQPWGGWFLFFQPAARQQLEKEIRAQFAAFARTGLPLDHVSVHDRWQLHPTVLGSILRVGREFGLGAVRLPSPLSAGASHRCRRPVAVGLALWAMVASRRLRRTGLLVNDRLLDLPVGRQEGGGLTPTPCDPPTGLTEIRLLPIDAGQPVQEWLAPLIELTGPILSSDSGFSRGGYADAGSEGRGRLAAGSAVSF